MNPVGKPCNARKIVQRLMVSRKPANACLQEARQQLCAVPNHSSNQICTPPLLYCDGDVGTHNNFTVCDVHLHIWVELVYI